MSETNSKRVKKINRPRLEKLSDAELLERIQQKEIRINSKFAYYEKMHNLNLERLESYMQYREQDAKTCQEILDKRKGPANIGEKKE
jgi:ribosome biogenesis protein Tsr3